jgi:hypothetical protein
MTFLLSDPQQSMRTRSERAFQHLSWQIVVDDEVRDKWQKCSNTHAAKNGARNLAPHIFSATEYLHSSSTRREPH